MVELSKEKWNMLRIKSKAASQLTFDEDYNVPDAKPDIGRMIQHKGEVQVEEVKLGENRAFLRAVLAVDLLYVGDGEEGRVYSLTARIPIEETLNLEGIEAGDKICLKWDIEDLSLQVIHSRKLNIKSIVTFFASADELSQIPLPTGISGDEAPVKKKRVNLMGLALHKRDTMRVREEIALASNKPNIHEILWDTIEVRGLDIRPGEGNLQVRGELFVFALYDGDDEGNPLQWMEHSLTFTGEVECEDCTLEMIPDVEVSVLQQGMEVKPDADGEARLLQVDVVLELGMKIYEEREYELLLDVYIPHKECRLLTQTEVLESLLVRNFSKCRVNDRVNIRRPGGKILQICHSHGNVKIDESRIVENGIVVEGVVQVKVLYIVGDDNMPFYSTEAMVPFTHMIEAEGITESCSYHLRADLEQLSTTMVDSSEIEVKLVMNLNVLVIRREPEEIIRQVEEAPLDRERIQAMPGIAVYFVRPGDTLWDIAKSFYTTVEEIRRLNNIEEGEARPGQSLLLVKNVCSSSAISV